MNAAQGTSIRLSNHAIISAALILLYIGVVATLRYRRAHGLYKRYGIASRCDFARLTADQAQMILKDLAELEFPILMSLSMTFALFKVHLTLTSDKTYGVPTISSVLVGTGELRNLETASKRTADTGVLLLEFALKKPSSKRSTDAVARMNYLHSRYQRSGKIFDSDMLYTLSLFALETIRWIDRYEWRLMTDLERCASGTFWKAMGDDMQISYNALPSYKTGWRDGLHWLEEIEEWSLGYEAEKMVPADVNNRLAQAHITNLFYDLSPPNRVIPEKVVAVLVGERLRKAMQ
ncbi:MAG: hypothetical protein Q9165_001925 [Trypethelium subeluteriae]